MIVPHNLPAQTLSDYLQKAQAELLIAEAGAVDLSLVTKGNQQLSHVIWVAKQGSRHMEWNQVPEGIGGRIEVAVWHELVKDKKTSVSSEVPEWEPKSPTPSITTVWPSTSGVGEFVEYEPKVRRPRLIEFFFLSILTIIEFCVCHWSTYFGIASQPASHF